MDSKTFLIRAKHENAGSPKVIKLSDNSNTFYNTAFKFCTNIFHNKEKKRIDFWII